MTIKTQHINFGGEELILTNQRAIFWQKHKTLIISDLHIGKTAHFRRSGIAVSSKVLEADLKRLHAIISFFDANRVIVVGDMFHAELNEDILIFTTWLDGIIDVQWTLIKGNHDRWPSEVYDLLAIEIAQPMLTLKPFIFSHDIPKKIDQHYCISGHIHPGIRIKGRGKQYIKLPCYQLMDKQLILPAFSSFTGLNTNGTSDMCIHYAFTETSIFQI